MGAKPFCAPPPRYIGLVEVLTDKLVNVSVIYNDDEPERKKFVVIPDVVFFNPCGGRVEYLHRDPASRKRRRNWTKKKAAP
jgi:hypothetical protein